MNKVPQATLVYKHTVLSAYQKKKYYKNVIQSNSHP